MAVIKSLKTSTDLLQHIAACPLLLTFFLGPFFAAALSIYIVFFTQYYAFFFLYLIWMAYDLPVCFKDGRRLKWLRSMPLWTHMRDYFPQKIVMTSDLPSDRNYLICIFPHGIFCTSVFAHFLSETSEFYKKFPKLNVTCHTLNINFCIPFVREYTLGLGFTSVSRESILHQLEKPSGQASVVFVGGSKEALKSSLGEYRLVLKNRKGFVRLALTTGSCIVPTFVFHEVDVYDQWIFPKDSMVRKAQEFIRQLTGIACCAFLGKGFMGLVPYKVPVTTVVGKPIPVERIEKPTTEQVNCLHEKFIKELTDLFEDNKHKYLRKPEGVHLIFED